MCRSCKATATAHSNRPVTYPAGSLPRSVVSGHFNGDANLDLAVVNFGSSDVSVLLGNGDGTFQPAVNYPVGDNPRSATAGDFDGDGKMDLATANSGSNNVSILLGNGDGTFQSAANFGADSNPFGIAAGDFDHNGKLDLAVANFDANDVSILLNTSQCDAPDTDGDGVPDAVDNCPTTPNPDQLDI